MSITVSTKFKELILGSSSFIDIFDGGRILVFGGTRPANPDLANVEPALAEITTNGIAWTPYGPGGLTYIQSGAWILKNPAVSWKIKCANSGVASWFRIVGPETDDGSASVVLPRIDGSVGADGAYELVLPSVNLEAGSVLAIPQFFYTIPPLN